MKLKKLTPNFCVTNVKESVAFYRDKLGFALAMAVPEGSKNIDSEIDENQEYAYAMVSRDEVFVMLMKADVFVEDLPLLKSVPQGASVSFYIEVEDIDKIYAEIKGKTELAKELETTWYGMQEFYIKDCNGYVLGFAEARK